MAPTAVSVSHIDLLISGLQPTMCAISQSRVLPVILEYYDFGMEVLRKIKGSIITISY